MADAPQQPQNGRTQIGAVNLGHAENKVADSRIGALVYPEQFSEWTLSRLGRSGGSAD